MKRYLYSFIILIFLPYLGFAQLPSNPLGLNPYRLKWQQINTDKVQVVFPEGQEAAGQKVANIVHHLWQMPNQSIGNRHKKVSIFLQNQTTIPNGFVTVGPFRSEFYLAPPQFNFAGTTDWLYTLSIHEYRHVMQLNNARQGLTKLAKNTFGSWAWGGFAGMALPRWYWEGDAIVAETALTRSGRGRMPAFEMEFRSLILDNKKYHYEKASAGSLRDFVPDHYNLGYYLTAYARRKFGEDIWQKVLSDAVRYKGIFHPFSRSLRKHTGLRTRDLYNAMRQELDSTWQAEAQSIDYTETQTLKTEARKTYTDYENAHLLSDGTVVAEKSGFDQIPIFVRIYPDGREKRLSAPGLNASRNRTLSLQNNTLCWAELSYDARWLGKDFSIIRTYNLQTKERRKLSFRSRYFAPALSSDASEVVAVKHDESQKTNLVILDAYTGNLKQVLPNPEGYFFSHPRWVENAAQVVVVAQREESQHLRLYDLNTGESRALSQPSTHHISNPYAKGEYVYFSGSHTGIQNIFAVALNEQDNKLYQVTNVKVGALQPSVSPDGKTLLMSEFSTEGYTLSQIPIDRSQWKVWQLQDEPKRINYHQALVEQEGGSIIGNINEENFAVSKYNKWQGIINPHSLVPYFYPPVYGLRLLSDNKFSTLSAELQGYYNQNEDNFTYGANLRYAELFPVINAGVTFSRRSRTLYSLAAETDTTLTAGFLPGEWNERNMYLGLELPLNLTQGNHRTRANFRLNYHWIDIERLHSEVAPEGSRFRVLLPEGVSSNRLRNLFTNPQRSELTQAIDFRFSFTRQQAMAVQHIYPRFAQVFVLRYRSTLSSENQGSVFYALGDLYFPGFFRNHSLFFNAAYQRELFTDNYKFANFFPYPRGYNSYLSDDISKIGINYAFPLFYPDMRIGGLLFLKRVKVNLFFDYARTEATSLEPIFRPIVNDLRSLGAELTFDVRLLRLIEGNLGLRYSYAMDRNDAHQVEFLLLRLGI